MLSIQRPCFLPWRFWCGCGLLWLLCLATGVQGQIEWRVSVKFFTDASGNPPTGAGSNVNSPEAVTNRIAEANAILDARGRGYRYRIVEVVNISGSNNPKPATSTSWFSVAVNSGSQDDLDSKAKANKTRFSYNDNAINFYITGSSGGANGGYCSFPSEGQDVILVAQDSFSDVLIHESGHYFGLMHTFNSGGVCKNGVPQSTGDDGISDTAPDYPCGTRDDLAQAIYSKNYTALSIGQQAYVNSAWLNVMSYHSPGSLFTEDQMDVITDNSNHARRAVATGRTWFVDKNSSCLFPNGDSSCSLFFGGPFKSIGDGLGSAGGNDIVLIRSGVYDQPTVIQQPVTLRATRGLVILGPP